MRTIDRVAATHEASQALNVAVVRQAGYFRHGDIPQHGQLFYEARQPDGTFVSANADAGAPFEAGSGEWYGITRGDLNADGCVDLVVTPREVLQYFPKGVVTAEGWHISGDAFDYDAPGVRVLLNQCMYPENAWIGFRVPDVPGYVVTLTRSDGTVRRRAVKGSSGVGSRSGGGMLHFGLGADLDAAEAVLSDTDGAPIASLELPASGAYHSLGWQAR